MRERSRVRSSGSSPSPLPRYHHRQQRQRRTTTAPSCRPFLTSDKGAESELRVLAQYAVPEDRTRFEHTIEFAAGRSWRLLSLRKRCSG